VPYDVDATVEAITQVLGDPALRRRLEEGALRAARRSTWDAVVEEQLALYTEALAG
jgi:glycosyltransferase involved in cell wall biosynthesis